MREDRSWVTPLAFIAFGGILIAAMFAFLWAEELLLTERGAALVAWLTLIMTMLAVAAALTALFVALRQLQKTERESQTITLDLLDELEATVFELTASALKIIKNLDVESYKNGNYGKNLAPYTHSLSKLMSILGKMDRKIADELNEELHTYCKCVYELKSIFNDYRTSDGECDFDKKFLHKTAKTLSKATAEVVMQSRELRIPIANRIWRFDKN